MKKTLLSIALSTVMFSAFAAQAQAADGTVKFAGNIIDETCTVDAGSADQVVTLGDVASSAFSAKGDTAAPTEFSIKLTACPAGTVNAKFDGTSDIGNPDDLALDAGQTAAGVAVQITDGQNNVVNLHEVNDSAAVTVDGTGNATLDFIGRYQATAATVTAGTANATSQFTVVYN